VRRARADAGTPTASSATSRSCGTSAKSDRRARLTRCPRARVRAGKALLPLLRVQNIATTTRKGSRHHYEKSYQHQKKKFTRPNEWTASLPSPPSRSPSPCNERATTTVRTTGSAEFGVESRSRARTGVESQHTRAAPHVFSVQGRGDGTDWLVLSSVGSPSKHSSSCSPHIPSRSQASDDSCYSSFHLRFVWDWGFLFGLAPPSSIFRLFCFYNAYSHLNAISANTSFHCTVTRFHRSKVISP
jgi:hypothetical protein